MQRKIFGAQLEEDAAHWFLRLQEEDVAPADIQGALLWQNQSPAHHTAFERVEKMWQLAGKLPATDEIRTASHRWNFWRLAAAALLPVMIMVSAIIALIPHQAPIVGHYATLIGETRTITLSDKSRLVLGAASSATVTYTNSERRVFLATGEALFDVAKDKDRPFIVESGGAETRDFGTVFDIHRQLSSVIVTVAEGIVQVQPVAAGKQSVPAARLGAGHQVRYSERDGLGPIVQVPPDRATVWQSGRLVFNDCALADALNDLGRYSSKSILLASPEIGDLKVTGVVEANRIEEWLRGLAMIMPVTVKVSAAEISIGQSSVQQSKTTKKKMPT